ncbi:MAG TPA: alpha/beta hydrolase, partial [Chitinophagaceae bacterium]|nr:alpha/beta hydrolase [Chitinophagaceae bacterium]
GMVHYVQQSGLDQLALAYMQKWQPSASKEELGKVKQDVLIICGDKDNANGSGEELSKLFHHVQYVQVPGEHNNASGTKEFADAVVQFLKK